MLLDDGRISLSVSKIEGKDIFCKVVRPGVLHSKKGLNLQGGGLSASSLTSKDIEDINTIVNLDVDYIALSFVKSCDDIKQLRSLLRAKETIKIIAKIERKEAVENLQSILDSSDGLMVARETWLLK